MGVTISWAGILNCVKTRKVDCLGLPWLWLPRRDGLYPQTSPKSKSLLSLNCFCPCLSQQQRKERQTGQQDVDRDMPRQSACHIHQQPFLNWFRFAGRSAGHPCFHQPGSETQAVPVLISLLTRLLPALSLKSAFPDAPKFSPLLPPPCFQVHIFQDALESQIRASWNRRCFSTCPLSFILAPGQRWPTLPGTAFLPFCPRCPLVTCPPFYSATMTFCHLFSSR